MARTETYKIVFQTILETASGRKLAILARKCLALRAGMGSTAELNLSHPREAVELLQELSNILSGMVARLGFEPADPSDDGRHPVSLEQFCMNAERIERETSARALQDVKDLIAARNWEDAGYLAISGLYTTFGSRRREMVGHLGQVAQHDSKARLFFAKCLLRGDSCRKNVARAEGLLKEITADPDANNAGYAHLLLGEAIMDQPQRGYEALRHFEGAAYLGWEDASEYAGALCQLGQNGVPHDMARAVKNYRYGIAHGHAGCMIKYALMVLAGDIAYDPAWEALYEKALRADNGVALTFHKTVLDAKEKGGGDIDRFLLAFREQFTFQTSVEVAEFIPVAE